MSVPFVVGGALKGTYDLLLYRLFREIQPPEELEAGRSRPMEATLDVAGVGEREEATGDRA